MVVVVVRNQAKGREKTEKEEKEEDGRGEEKRKKTLETRGRRGSWTMRAEDGELKSLAEFPR